MLLHSCSNSQCSHNSPRTTRYHTCPLCNNKLVFNCPNCKEQIFSSNLKHQKKCTKITTSKGQSSEYLFGKKKIMLKRNQEKICIAFFNNSQFNFGKERKKFDSLQCKTKLTRKEKIKHLQMVNDVPCDVIVTKFSSIIDMFVFVFFNLNLNFNYLI